MFNIPSTVQSGDNELIISKLPYPAGDKMSFQYYIKTNQAMYYANWVEFIYQPVDVDLSNQQDVVPGQEITISGDFNIMNDQYRLVHIIHIGSGINTEAGYRLSEDKKLLSFTIPSDAVHGTVTECILYNDTQNTPINLGFFRVIGSLKQPEKRKYYYEESMNFSGKGLPYGESRVSMPFFIIVGNQTFRYLDKHPIYTLVNGQKGTSFRIGYYNGLDTTIFSERLELHIPPDDLILTDREMAHPHDSFGLNLVQLRKYIPIDNSFLSLGDWAIPNSDWNESIILDTKNIPEGDYYFSFKNDIYHFTSKNKIVVQKLKINPQPPLEVNYDESIVLTGNFIEHKNYHIKAKDREVWVQPASKGKLTITPTSVVGATSHEGKQMEIEQIGYANGRGHITWTNVNIKVDFRTVTYTGFSPLSGNRGTTITVYGNGIAASHIFMGGQQVRVYESGDGYASFSIPSSILPGKHKIAVYHQEGWLTHEQFFDLK